MRPVLALLLVPFLVLAWLRWPEPPGLDQSLFAYYGQEIGHGSVLYRDLWDSKPPGIFAVYALATRVAGVRHAALVLDLLAALLAAWLAARLAAAFGAAAGAPARWVGPTAAAAFALFLPSAPAFGGPMVAGQAETILSPIVLGALLVARRPGTRPAVVAGLLLGLGATLKIVAVAFLPLLWIVAPGARPGVWRAAALLAGFVAPPLLCAVGLAAQGALTAGFEAVLVYPRAYAAEVAARMPLERAAALGAERLGRGFPVVLLAALAALSAPRRRALLPLGLWLLLAMLAIAAQRQMAGYHLALLLPVLAVSGGVGVLRFADWGARAWRGSQRGEVPALAALAVMALVALAAVALEARLWIRHYAPHRALVAGRIPHDEFLAQLGGPGPAWLEAGFVGREIGAALAARPEDAPGGRARLLVWGLAPAVYARSGCAPATRWAFHQTLLVAGSPLARRWPDASRETEFTGGMRRNPPRFVVIVSGDRSGMEPQDSRAELVGFPALRELLESQYRALGASRFYELLEYRAPDR